MLYHFFSFFVVAIGILFQISIMRDVDSVFSILLAMVFFRPLGHVFVYALISGLILDMYSPLFGLRSFLSIMVLVVIYQLSVTLFTNRSFPSFIFLGVCASLAFSSLFALMSAGVASLTGFEYLFPVFSFEAIRQGSMALLSQMVVLSFLYPLFSRTVQRNI